MRALLPVSSHVCSNTRLVTIDPFEWWLLEKLEKGSTNPGAESRLLVVAENTALGWRSMVDPVPLIMPFVGFVSGEVTAGARSSPVGGATVDVFYLRDDRWELVGSGASDKSRGAYRVEIVIPNPPPGETTLEVLAVPSLLEFDVLHRFKCQDGSDDSCLVTVAHAALDELSITNVQFEDLTAAPLRGRVSLPGTGLHREGTDEDCPVPGVQIEITTLVDGFRESVQNITTDAEGRFDLAVAVGLPRVEIKASLEGHLIMPQRHQLFNTLQLTEDPGRTFEFQDVTTRKLRVDVAQGLCKHTFPELVVTLTSPTCPDYEQPWEFGLSDDFKEDRRMPAQDLVATVTSVTVHPDVEENERVLQYLHTVYPRCVRMCDSLLAMLTDCSGWWPHWAPKRPNFSSSTAVPPS